MTDSTQFDLPSSLSVDLHNDIAVLSLSRPEKRNAIDFPMIRGLDRFFSELSDRLFSELSDSIRAVVMYGPFPESKDENGLDGHVSGLLMPARFGLPVWGEHSGVRCDHSDGLWGQ
jgi:hypothetical protein